jgi:hypothetical protein
VRARRAAAIAGGAALALVALAALRVALGKSLGDWVAARERARFEREVGPLDPARLASPELAEADNAVPALIAATAALELAADERDLLRRSELDDGLDEAGLASLDARLASRDGDLAALAAAARRPGSSFGPRTELFHGNRFDLSSWLTAARLAAADGRRALAAGDRPRVDRSLDALLGLTVAIRREPIASFAIVGAAIESIYLDLVRAAVAAGADAATLDRLAGDLERLRDLPDAHAVMHGEATLGHDMLRRTPTVRRPDATARERIEALVWPWSEGHVEAGYLAGWRELARYARTPEARWPPIDRIVRGRQGALRRWLDPTAPFETVRTMLFPSLLSVVSRLQRLVTTERLARLAVAISSHAARDGALPASLDGLPAAAEGDPAGEPLWRYAVGADGSATIEAPIVRERIRGAFDPAPSAGRRADERNRRLLSWTIPPPAIPPD